MTSQTSLKSSLLTAIASSLNPVSGHSQNKLVEATPLQAFDLPCDIQGSTQKKVIPTTEANQALVYLKGFVEYDPINGGFRVTYKRHYKSPNVGEPLGYPHADGYLQTKIKQRAYLIHRLVYAWHTGEWPSEIDHINGTRTDNRIENLRAANPAITARNRKALDHQYGNKGVSFHKATGKYIARVRSKGKQLFYGLYPTQYLAIEARREFLINNPELGFTHREY